VSALRPTGTSQRNAADEDERASKSSCRSDACVTPPKAGAVDLDDEWLRVGLAVRLARGRARVNPGTVDGDCNCGDGPDHRQNAQVHTETVSSSG
jgi:hypothetical protein